MTMRDNLIQALHAIANKRVLLLGDIILDRYIFGNVDRISPEAPVPVLSVSHEKYVPGGASNVASNIASLGGQVTILGVVGNDTRKEIIIEELRKKRVNCASIIVDNTRPTIEKARMLAGQQQLLRVDYEDTNYINFNYEDQLYEKVTENIDNADCVVISDYAKGVVTRRLLERVIPLCHEKKKIILIDPKPKHKAYYKGATYVTPNHKELCEMAGKSVVNDDGKIISLGRELAVELDTTIILTRGEKGMTIVPRDREGFSIPTKAREVYDVSGAGDTVVAMLSLALAAGVNLETACKLANYAAGIVVGKQGTSTVTSEEVQHEITVDITDLPV